MRIDVQKEGAIVPVSVSMFSPPGALPEREGWSSKSAPSRRPQSLEADRVGREGTTVRAFLEGEGDGPRLKAMLFRAPEGRLVDALLAQDRAPLHLAGTCV
jgi:hypothetical protein